MARRVFDALVVAGMAIAPILGVEGCNSDPPTKPEEMVEVLYIPHIYYSTPFPWVCRIYVYETENMTVVDSIDVDDLPLEMLASRDGDWLYIRASRQLSPYVAKISAHTGSVAWKRPKPGLLRLLDNGRILALEESSGGKIVNQETGEAMRGLPDSLRLGFGPIDGTEVAAIVTDSIEEVRSDSIVTILDCKTGITRGRFTPHFGGASYYRVYSARLLPDGDRVAVIGKNGGSSWFEIGSTSTGESLLSFTLSKPFGETDVSADGSRLAVTDADGLPPTVDIVNLQSLDITRRLSFPPPVVYRMSEVRFSADHAKLILAPGPGGGDDPLFIIDTGPLVITDTIWRPGCRPAEYTCPMAGGVALGQRPISKLQPETLEHSH